MCLTFEITKMGVSLFIFYNGKTKRLSKDSRMQFQHSFKIIFHTWIHIEVKTNEAL